MTTINSYSIPQFLLSPENSTGDIRREDDPDSTPFELFLSHEVSENSYGVEKKKISTISDLQIDKDKVDRQPLPVLRFDLDAKSFNEVGILLLRQLFERVLAKDPDNSSSPMFEELGNHDIDLENQFFKFESQNNELRINEDSYSTLVSSKRYSYANEMVKVKLLPATISKINNLNSASTQINSVFSETPAAPFFNGVEPALEHNNEKSEILDIQDLSDLVDFEKLIGETKSASTDIKMSVLRGETGLIVQIIFPDASLKNSKQLEIRLAKLIESSGLKVESIKFTYSQMENTSKFVEEGTT